MRINGFEQIKGFYSWVFDNQEKNIKPQHISLYLFMLNQNNRNNWVEWFKMPFDLAMTGSCISSKKTYYSCLADLKVWGLIQYEKGVNNWKAPLVKVEVLKDTSTVPQCEPQQHLNGYGHSTAVDTAAVPQPVPNIKPITYNNKLITSNELQEEILKFFGFEPTAQNVNHQRLISGFFLVKEKTGELNHFIDQFIFYADYIRKSGKVAFRFRLENFLGSQKDSFNDGKWNAENWKQKLTESVPVAPIILGYTPQLPSN